MTDLPEFDLAPQQQAAADKIKLWYEDESKEPIHRLFGYAGTGKTTTIRKIIEQLDLGMGSDVLFAAYTGKAAMVMRKNNLPASTIHSLIYKPVMPDAKKCSELHKQLKLEPDDDVRKRIRKELNDASQVSFHLREDDELGPLEHCKLLVLDECSMVNDDMLADLMTFDIPLLVLGDPGQLPPIDGEGALTRAAPDSMLTEIHRQARDNPIIDFATRARNGIYLPKMRLGDSAHVNQMSLTNEQVLGFDQIMCGKNATRKMLNQRVRELKGFTTTYPVVGDKLICLRNNASQGLFNGMICTVREVGDMLDSSVELKISRETDEQDAAPILVKALRAHFDSYHDKDALDAVRWWERADSDEFDFGYAITVHKSQGSQWDNICLFDDKFFVWERATRNRWLYTGITRAVNSVIIAS